MTTKEENEAEAIARAHEFADLFGLAIYETVRLALAPSQDGRNRRRVKSLWRGVADKVIEFAKDGD